MEPSAQLFQACDLFIEVEIPQRDDKAFLRRYTDGSGHSATIGQAGLLRQENHGYNARMYFNAPELVLKQLAMFGYIPDFGKSRGHRHKKYTYRIDSNALFWKLVRNGFQLGPSQTAPQAVAA